MLKLIYIAIAVVISVTQQCGACECSPILFEREVAQSDLIFVGKVLKKAMNSDKLYYLFSVCQLFKGEDADTITISTGLGGGDCGMPFQLGRTYVVFANHKTTSHCTRTSLSDSSSYIGKLRFLFEEGFSGDVLKNGSVLTGSKEAEFLNSNFLLERRGFDFHNKRVLFYKGTSVTRQEYFRTAGGEDINEQLLVLTYDERQKINNYDAVVVLSEKLKVSKKYRKKIIERIGKQSKE